MSIRFINTTTNLPVDLEIEKIFRKTIRPTFQKSVESAQHLDHVDIFFVNEKHLDRERKKLDLDNKDNKDNKDHNGMDILGVYFSLHSEFHRPVIMVSPEKVMKACVSFKKNNANALSLPRLYPSLLIAVVIHELAHWIMDDDSIKDHDVTPWNWLTSRLEKDIEYNFDYSHHLASGCDRHSTWRHLRQFIEESLANAFVLKQKLDAEELNFLEAFISTQPQGYKQGVLWSGDLKATLKTAQTWAKFKRDGDSSRWRFIFDEKFPPVSRLVYSLQQGKSIQSADFVDDFYKYLVEHVSEWQSEYKKGKTAWGEHLNRTFGVFYTLTTLGKFHGIQPEERLQYLELWAGNGSKEAIDELNKTLSETAARDENYALAVELQRNRLGNLEAMKLNDYWRHKNSEDIAALITEFEKKIK